MSSTYRVIFRSGTYLDVSASSVRQVAQRITDDLDPIWTIVNLDILDGGDAYQALIGLLANTSATDRYNLLTKGE
jgi:hypothetical protein